MKAEEVSKRGPGRPPLANKLARHDMHLLLPDGLLQAIDTVRGADENRTQYIERVLRERPEIARILV